MMWPDWRGQTAVIVASGPSAADIDLAAARGRAKFLAINSSYKLCPYADVLYAADAKWWKSELPAFEGLRLSAESAPGCAPVTVVRGTDALLFDRTGEVGSGGNSGFQALNLAVQFGARTVVLVGFDMRLDRGVHWHGRHEKGLNNPSELNVARWRRALDAQAGPLREMGVEVLNASPVSALTAYRKVGFGEVVAALNG